MKHCFKAVLACYQSWFSNAEWFSLDTFSGHNETHSDTHTGRLTVRVMCTIQLELIMQKGNTL